MKEQLRVTLDDLPRLLPYIPSDDREKWIEVGMGLRSEFGDDAFDEFDKWSSTDKTYNFVTCQQVWKSFKLTGVGIGTVVKMALDNGWKPEQKEMSKEEKKRLKKEAEERRAKVLKQAEEDERLSAVMQTQVGNACFEIWEKHCATFGYSPYLERKKVKPHGIRFLKYSVLLVIDFSKAVEKAYVLTGEEVKKFFDALPKPRPDTLSYLRMLRKGIVVPIADENNILRGLQYINEQGTKLFPKFCKKSGSFHLLGQMTEQSSMLYFAEGYATAASVYESTGFPTVVSFDAGNMVAVSRVLHRKYPHSFKVFAGDDDVENAVNSGRKKAEQAAVECGGVAIFPSFKEVAV